MIKKRSNWVKIVVYVPLSHANSVRDTLNLYSGGKIGNYDYCSFSVQGIGRFRPLEGSKPHIGTLNTIEELTEERIETIVLQKDASQLIKAVQKVHPYEEPAIDIYPLLYP
jgi:hypothetical protein